MNASHLAKVVAHGQALYAELMDCCDAEATRKLKATVEWGAWRETYPRLEILATSGHDRIFEALLRHPY